MTLPSGKSLLEFFVDMPIHYVHEQSVPGTPVIFVYNKFQEISASHLMKEGYVELHTHFVRVDEIKGAPIFTYKVTPKGLDWYAITSL